ncbi:hypothetical protein ABPG74_017623 [Tetrahymena malaccensis]
MKFAIKVFDVDDGSKQNVSQEKVKECQKEAKAMTTFFHKNVVQYHSEKLLGLFYFILMQRCESSLYVWSQNNQNMIQNNVFYNIALQILDGLEFIHSKDWVLRDLKPQNILINYQNGQLEVKLCDFGAARHYPKLIKPKSTHFYGSLNYSPPEVIKQLKLQKENVLQTKIGDIWAYGICLSEIGKSKLNFDNYDKPNWVVPISPLLSEKAQKFVNFLLVPNPSNRPEIKEIREKLFQLFKDDIAQMCKLQIDQKLKPNQILPLSDHQNPLNPAPQLPMDIQNDFASYINNQIVNPAQELCDYIYLNLKCGFEINDENFPGDKESDQFAIKVFDVDDGSKNNSSQEKVKECQNEVNTIKTLNHKNLVKYHSDYQIGLFYFIQMQKCQSNLDIWSQKILRVIQNQLFYSIAVQILDGLEYLHSNGYILRDLKPQNILIKQKGEKIKIKLSYFGAVKDQPQLTNTKPANYYGSLAYTPPEILTQLLEKKIQVIQTKQGDIWAYGICLSTMGRSQLNFLDYCQKDWQVPVSLLLTAKAQQFINFILVQNPQKRPTLQQIRRKLDTLFKDEADRVQQNKKFKPNVIVPILSQNQTFNNSITYQQQQQNINRNQSGSTECLSKQTSSLTCEVLQYLFKDSCDQLVLEKSQLYLKHDEFVTCQIQMYSKKLVFANQLIYGANQFCSE